MNLPDSSIVVIFGASGDLTHRKLLPAIFSMFRQGLLAADWAVVGVGRKNLSDDDFRNQVILKFLHLDS